MDETEDSEEEEEEREHDLGVYLNSEIELQGERLKVLDYYYDVKECRWKEWLEQVEVEHPISNSLHLSI